MSNINKQALREAAEKALPAMQRLLMMPNDELFDEALLNVDGDVDAANAFNLLTGPETLLALLDELEAKDVTRSAQDYHFGQQANRIESLERSLEAAEKRIAELEAEKAELRPVGVMSEKAFYRLEQSESRFIALWPRPGIHLPRKRPLDSVVVYARVVASAGIGKGE